MVSNGALVVPTVDISAFTANGNAESRKRVADDLAEKVRVNGCVGISGHGVAPEKLEKAFGVIKKLFELPYEDKMKAPHPDGIVPHRGYSGMGSEKGSAKTALETNNEAQDDAISDYKESYEVGSDDNIVQYNIWLPEDVLPGFRTSATELFWELNKTANAVLEALIAGLGVTDEEANAIRSLHTGHDNQLRLSHYPSIPSEMLKQRDIGRLGTHSDWSSFTILFQDATGGLEFADRKTGDFMAATPKEGMLYMNIGDMFHRISNGLYPSGLHRVVVSGKATGEPTPARYSIPYFVLPLADEVIEPQPSMIAALGKQNYEAVTFSSYSDRTYQAIRLKASE